MGHLPVARPSPPDGVRMPRAGIALVLALVSLLAILGVALAFGWPIGQQVETGSRSWKPLGEAQHFKLWTPIRFNIEESGTDKVHALHVVRLADEIVALQALDTNSGCTLPWRPDFEFLGRKGWFRDPCRGATYDVDGTCVSGPCPRNLDRYPVRVQNGLVEVDLSRVTSGSARPFDGAPLPRVE